MATTATNNRLAKVFALWRGAATPGEKAAAAAAFERIAGRAPDAKPRRHPQIEATERLARQRAKRAAVLRVEHAEQLCEVLLWAKAARWSDVSSIRLAIGDLERGHDLRPGQIDDLERMRVRMHRERRQAQIDDAIAAAVLRQKQEHAARAVALRLRAAAQPRRGGRFVKAGVNA